MKMRFLFSVLLCAMLAFSSSVLADTDESSPIEYRVFVGVQPAVTAEPFDNQNVIDVNVIPLLIECALRDNLGIRLNPIFNLRCGDGVNGAIAQIGINTIVPFYFQARTEEQPYRGLYGGPNVASTYSVADQAFALTLAGEIGYAFVMSPRMMLNVALQAGATFFWDQAGSRTWPHNGFFVNFGYWIR
ncbi:MAG: hypothetical protein ACE5JP_16015 [Candidatus Bipolaricaulia bacterium]